MFGKNLTDLNNSNTENVNLNEENSTLEESPIHTLESDLKEIQNPSIKQAIPNKTTRSNKNNPFLSTNYPENQEKTNNEVDKIIEATKDKPLNITENNNPETIHNSKNNPPGKIKRLVFTIVVIFIIMIFGGGGYYFWITRLTIPTEQKTILNELPENLPKNETEQKITQIAPNLSAQNLNYLQIDLSQANSENLRQTINKYSNSILSTNEIGIFEFLITDEKNIPVSFQDFSTILDINLLEILPQISQDFTFLIYNYGEKTRFGLILNSLNSTDLKNTLEKEEKNLYKSIYPLYQKIDTPVMQNFSSATYKNHSIRYLNITSADDYAIDYTIVGNKLVIGTTKSTMFSALDRLSE